VYAEGRAFAAAAYLGTRPTFDDGAPMLEVFLLGFDGDLYGREIAVEFIGYIRGDAKFDSMEALKAQIGRDCAEAQAIVDAAPIHRLRRAIGQ
jgi:riboflavin kinase/FMN adenylyltransferase